jgi:hypothetical protein
MTDKEIYAMKLPAARNHNIVISELEKELLVYDLTAAKAYCLNETSAVVFNACGRNQTFDDLKRQYEFSDDLIHLALNELKKQDLIESDYVLPFAGMNRRELIRKVGLSTMIALPVITGLIAPRAAGAQSLANLALGQTCTSSAQCSSSAPNCANRSPSTGVRRCCAGADSRFDTGGVVNSCSGGNCSSATFACQSDAGQFCCSNSATASCTGNSCACRCN